MWPPFFFGAIPTYGVTTVHHDICISRKCGITLKITIIDQYITLFTKKKYEKLNTNPISQYKVPSTQLLQERSWDTIDIFKFWVEQKAELSDYNVNSYML